MCCLLVCSYVCALYLFFSYSNAIRRQQRKVESLQAQRQALSGYAEEREKMRHISALRNKQKTASSEIVTSIPGIPGPGASSSVSTGHTPTASGVAIGSGNIGTGTAAAAAGSVQLVSMRQLKSIARQVLSALTLLKEMHIIHADVKPQNICIKNPASIQYLVDHFALPSGASDGVQQAGRPNRAAPFAHTLLDIDVVLIDFSCSCYEDEKYRPQARRNSFADDDLDNSSRTVEQVAVNDDGRAQSPALPSTVDASIASVQSIDGGANADAHVDVDSDVSCELEPVGFDLACGSDAPVVDDDSGILFFDHQHSHISASISDSDPNLGQTIPVAAPAPNPVPVSEPAHPARAPIEDHHPPLNKYIQSRFYRAPEVLLEHPYGKSLTNRITTD